MSPESGVTTNQSRVNGVATYLFVVLRPMRVNRRQPGDDSLPCSLIDTQYSLLRTLYSGPIASHNTSAGCFVFLPVRCSICWGQEMPDATISTSLAAALTAGARRRLPILSDRS